MTYLRYWDEWDGVMDGLVGGGIIGFILFFFLNASGFAAFVKLGSFIFYMYGAV